MTSTSIKNNYDFDSFFFLTTMMLLTKNRNFDSWLKIEILYVIIKMISPKNYRVFT